MHDEAHLNDHIPTLAISRGPAGLADLLAPFGVSVAELKSRLEGQRSGTVYRNAEATRSLDVRASDDTIVVAHARLSAEIDILHIAGCYYLRLKGTRLPETIMTALPARQLSTLVGGVGIPAHPAITIDEARTLRSDERLIRLSWPTVDC